MSKNILQDIVKIKNPRKVEVNQNKLLYPDAKQMSPIEKEEYTEPKKVSYKRLWLVALISVVFLFFAISILFSSAKVTVNPKMKDFNFNKDITATKSTSVDGLSYDLVILQGEESKEMQGGEEKEYQESAKGKVLIYNSFSSAPQNLLIDTRLEGSNGKIYKTKSKVTVPGMTKGDVPGKIEVEIYGSEVGEDYNSAPLDFKVFGFKGTSKYSKIYARSIGEIKGGLKGKSRQISESEKENAIKELKDTLFVKLLEKAKNQIPENFVMLKDASFISISEEKIIPISGGENFTISIKGTFNGILFNKDKLAKEVIKMISSDDESINANDMYIFGIENLAFSQPNLESVVLNDLKDITFNLSGTPKVVWKVDSEKLTEDLLGKKKKDFSQVLSQYPNIDSADLVIKPVWENSLPEKIKNIKIIINNPK